MQSKLACANVHDECIMRSMFKMQEVLIEQLRDVDPIPALPIDMSHRDSQLFCRDIVVRAVEELFEALTHLKRWKRHRPLQGEPPDMSMFLEEVVDCMHYIVELLIVTGIKPEQLHDAFIAKHRINMKRARLAIAASDKA